MQFYELSQYGKPIDYIIPAVWHSRKEGATETIKSSEVIRGSGQGREWRASGHGTLQAAKLSVQRCNGEESSYTFKFHRGYNTEIESYGKQHLS